MQKSNKHAKTTILIKAIIFGITNIHGSLNELLYIVLTDNFYSVLFKEFRISSFDVSQRVFDKLVNMINAINLSSFTDLQWKKCLGFFQWPWFVKQNAIDKLLSLKLSVLEHKKAPLILNLRAYNSKVSLVTHIFYHWIVITMIRCYCLKSLQISCEWVS